MRRLNRCNEDIDLLFIHLRNLFVLLGILLHIHILRITQTRCHRDSRHRLPLIWLLVLLGILLYHPRLGWFISMSCVWNLRLPGLLRGHRLTNRLLRWVWQCLVGGNGGILVWCSDLRSILLFWWSILLYNYKNTNSVTSIYPLFFVCF